MYESVMNAFQNSSMGPSEAETEKQLIITDEIIAERITENHPKVTDLTAAVLIKLANTVVWKF